MSNVSPYWFLNMSLAKDLNYYLLVTCRSVAWQRREFSWLLQRLVCVNDAEHSQHLHRLPHVRVRASLLRPHAVLLRCRTTKVLRSANALRSCESTHHLRQRSTERLWRHRNRELLARLMTSWVLTWYYFRSVQQLIGPWCFVSVIFSAVHCHVLFPYNTVEVKANSILLILFLESSCIAGVSITGNILISLFGGCELNWIESLFPKSYEVELDRT